MIFATTDIALLGGYERNMLFGTFFNQIDAKGRVRIPSKLKAALGKDTMVTRGTNGCLFLYSQKEFLALVEKVDAVPLSDMNSATPVRVLFSSAQELEEDNQGRTMIPQALRQLAKLDKDIVFMGVGKRAEIWSREAYDKSLGTVDFDKEIGKLKEYGV